MFRIAGLVLLILALGLIGFGCWRLAAAIATHEQPVDETLLSSVGYVIVTVAVSDVAKFLVQKVVNERERRIASEARRSSTKFISTMATFLEPLVTFDARDRVHERAHRA